MLRGRTSLASLDTCISFLESTVVGQTEGTGIRAARREEKRDACDRRGDQAVRYCDQLTCLSWGARARLRRLPRYLAANRQNDITSVIRVNDGMPHEAADRRFYSGVPSSRRVSGSGKVPTS